jgi:DNA-binding response OmpR family regulator
MGRAAESVESILVVDDDRTVHTYLRRVLAKGGFRVYGALDAVQGSIMARQTRPDLVILDVAMPGGGGPAVLERLKNLQGTNITPVLVYSGLGGGRAENLMPAADGDTDVAFVSKPGDPDELLHKIHLLLGHA